MGMGESSENHTPSAGLHLYDALIEELSGLLSPYEETAVYHDIGAQDFVWKSVENQFLLKSEAAVELGGGNLPAVSGVLCTTDSVGAKFLSGSPSKPAFGVVSGTGSAFDAQNFVSDANSVSLYGPDLPALKGDCPYARIALIRVREEFTAEEYKLYNLLRSIEYVRYHVGPDGYMPRISTVQNREQVRVGREALSRGLDFRCVGGIYGEAYRKHPAVESVKIIFITLEGFDYPALQNLLDRAERITMALDHPLQNLKMDCNSCNLKPVCDEAEALCT